MVQQSIWNGKKVYVLSNKILTLLICPDDGMDIYDMVYNDISIINWDEERYKQKLTYGIPILYPTPNRVENNKISFEGNSYEAKMHGLVRNEKFTVKEETVTKNSCELEAYLDWNKTVSKEFEMFPFESRLEINISLDRNEIHYTYKVMNQSNKRLPYGFGIHPFFNRISENTSVILPSGNVMEMDERKFPTGKKIENFTPDFDLRKGKKINELNLDHVYVDCSDNLKAQIMYEDFQINLKATKDFNFVVVYTPEKDFFCIENQTCATNAHNLYQKGYKTESGLIIVEPGQTKSGSIQFEFI